MYDLDLIYGLLGEVCDVCVDLRPHEENLFGLDLDVRGLSASPAERLVDHDTSVGKRSPLALGTRPYIHGESQLKSYLLG